MEQLIVQALEASGVRFECDLDSVKLTTAKDVHVFPDWESCIDGIFRNWCPLDN